MFNFRLCSVLFQFTVLISSEGSGSGGAFCMSPSSAPAAPATGASSPWDVCLQ